MSEIAIFRQLTKSAYVLPSAAGPATLQAAALKVLLDEAGTEVNVELE